MAMLNNQRVSPKNSLFFEGIFHAPDPTLWDVGEEHDGLPQAQHHGQPWRGLHAGGEKHHFSLRKGAQMATNRGEVVYFPIFSTSRSYCWLAMYHISVLRLSRAAPTYCTPWFFPLIAAIFWLVRSPSSQTSLALGWRHWKRTPSKNRTNRWGGWDFDWRKFGIWPILTSNNMISATKNQDETWWFEQQTGGFHQESCVDFTSTDEEKKHQHMVSWVCPCGFVEWGLMNNGYPKFYDISWAKGVILNHGPWGYLVFRQPRWRLSMTKCWSFRPDLLFSIVFLW